MSARTALLPYGKLNLLMARLLTLIYYIYVIYAYYLNKSKRFILEVFIFT